MGLVMDNTAALAPGLSAEERTSAAVRLLPSLTDVVVILTAIFLFACGQGTHSLLADCDTGWHIRTGQWILAHGQVPHRDIFSFTMPHQPWFAWEWLWDVGFALVYGRTGLGGVVLGSLAVLCLTQALLFRLVRRKCGNLLVAFLVTVVAMIGSSVHWLARPHLFTLLFGIIFYSILERAKEALETGATGRGRRLLGALPVLTVLWANLHGGFVLGILLTGTYAAGELARWALEEAAGRRAALARVRDYALAASGCLLASLLNPYGMGLHRHIAGYLTNAYIRDHINEFQTMSFHAPMAWAWEVMMALAAIAVFAQLQRKQFVYVLLCLGWMHLALTAGRNFPIFLLLAAPVVASEMGRWVAALAAADAPLLRRPAAALERLAADVDGTDRLPRVHLASVGALAAIGALMYAPAPPEKFRAEFDPKSFPVRAVEFLRSHGGAGRIFAADQWSDYIIYRLYPTKVFIDGRSDMYGDDFGEKYLAVMDVKHGWQKTLERYSVDTILLSTAAPLAGALKESQNWRVVYDDGVAIIFRIRRAAPGPGEQVSGVRADRGTGRDREITKSQQRDRRITQTTT